MFTAFKVIGEALFFLRLIRKYAKKKKHQKRIKDAIAYGKAIARGDRDTALDILARYLRV